MKILVTGSNGFIGKNLCAQLNNIAEGKVMNYNMDTDITVFPYDLGADKALLDGYCKECDFVVHLAGVNRPETEGEFMDGNFGFTSEILELLKKHGNTCPVMVSSSIQAELDNPYGRSKKAGEDLVFSYGEESGAKVLIYRFPNVFGKWCRPNYNSAVATFCHNIARDLPITVNNRDVNMTLVYIDDLVNEIIAALKGEENREGAFCKVPVEHKITLGEIVDLLYSFKAVRTDKYLPDLSDAFTNKLYATYLSYLPEGDFSYPLEMKADERGSFTEIFRTADRGQFNVNVSKPGVIKGNHWHNMRNEKFLVVSGKARVRFRQVDSESVSEYCVSGEKHEVIDVPIGYTYSIENIGDCDLVTIMWFNECFDPNRQDAFFKEV